MASAPQFAHHPPCAPDRERDPEKQRRRGAAAGADAERGLQDTADAWSRKVGVSGLKTISVREKG